MLLKIIKENFDMVSKPQNGWV